MLYASGKLCCQADGNSERALARQREARRQALELRCDICGAPGYAIAVVVEFRRDRPSADSAVLTDLIGLANHHLTQLAKAEHHYKRVGELQAALLAKSAAETATRVEEEISMRPQGQSIESKAQVERRMLEIEKFASAGRLAATIAHEVNNPMEAIKNAVYLLAGVIPESSLPVYNILKSETERVARVVRQMLGLYRDTEPVKPMSVNTIIEDTLLLLGHQLQKADVRVAAELGVLPDAFIAADQIRQVFTNLVINARDAMPMGGTLRIRSRHVIGRNPASSWIRILIADTGTGIPNELIADIFEPFVTTKGSGGTGLGLWIVKGIIQNHTGKITVRSKVGQGTVFRIDLPIAKP
jgi:signal transduction histidine kinase